MKRVVVLGAGGHAKVTVELLQALGHEVVGLLSPDAPEGATVSGLPVLGGDERLATLRADGVELAAVGVGSVAAGGLRRSLYERATAAGFTLPVLVHPTAHVSPSAELGPGCQVHAGAVVQAEARAAENVLINTRAVVEHETAVGAHTHVASGAVVAGGVTIGAGALIGAGASVLQGVRIGDGAVVGLGAAVIRDVSAGALVVGVPATERA